VSHRIAIGWSPVDAPRSRPRPPGERRQDVYGWPRFAVREWIAPASAYGEHDRDHDRGRGDRPRRRIGRAKAADAQPVAQLRAAAEPAAEVFRFGGRALPGACPVRGEEQGEPRGSRRQGTRTRGRACAPAAARAGDLRSSSGTRVALAGQGRGRRGRPSRTASPRSRTADHPAALRPSSSGSQGVPLRLLLLHAARQLREPVRSRRQRDLDCAEHGQPEPARGRCQRLLRQRRQLPGRSRGRLLLVRRRPALALRGHAGPAVPGIGRSRADVRPGAAGVPVRLRRVQAARRHAGAGRRRGLERRRQLVPQHDARFEQRELRHGQAQHRSRPEPGQPALRPGDRGLDRVLREQRGLSDGLHRQRRRQLVGRRLLGEPDDS